MAFPDDMSWIGSPFLPTPARRVPRRQYALSQIQGMLRPDVQDVVDFPVLVQDPSRQRRAFTQRWQPSGILPELWVLDVGSMTAAIQPTTITRPRVNPRGFMPQGWSALIDPVWNLSFGWILGTVPDAKPRPRRCQWSQQIDIFLWPVDGDPASVAFPRQDTRPAGKRRPFNPGFHSLECIQALADNVPGYPVFAFPVHKVTRTPTRSLASEISTTGAVWEGVRYAALSWVETWGNAPLPVRVAPRKRPPVQAEGFPPDRSLSENAWVFQETSLAIRPVKRRYPATYVVACPQPSDAPSSVTWIVAGPYQAIATDVYSAGSLAAQVGYIDGSTRSERWGR